MSRHAIHLAVSNPSALRHTRRPSAPAQTALALTIDDMQILALEDPFGLGIVAGLAKQLASKYRLKAKRKRPH